MAEKWWKSWKFDFFNLGTIWVFCAKKMNIFGILWVFRGFWRFFWVFTPYRGTQTTPGITPWKDILGFSECLKVLFWTVGVPKILRILAGAFLHDNMLKNRILWPISKFWTKGFPKKCLRMPLAKFDFLGFCTFLPYFYLQIQLKNGENRENWIFSIWAQYESSVYKEWIFLEFYEFFWVFWRFSWFLRRIELPWRL